MARPNWRKTAVFNLITASCPRTFPLADDFAGQSRPCRQRTQSNCFWDQECCHNEARRDCDAQCPSPSIPEPATPCAATFYGVTQGAMRWLPGARDLAHNRLSVRCTKPRPRGDWRMRPPTLHQVWNVLLPLVLLGSCLYCTERAPSGTEDPERVLPDFPARTLVAGPVPVDLRHSSIAEDIAVQRNGKFLYILSYTTLYQISGDTLTIEKTHSIDYQRGKGDLSTAISPDDETIALFKMPRLIVFLRSADLAVTGTLQIGESDYKTKLAFHPSSGYLYALTDRGELYEIDSGAAKSHTKTSPWQQRPLILRSQETAGKYTSPRERATEFSCMTRQAESGTSLYW